MYGSLGSMGGGPLESEGAHRDGTGTVGALLVDMGRRSTRTGTRSRRERHEGRSSGSTERSQTQILGLTMTRFDLRR